MSKVAEARRFTQHFFSVTFRLSDFQTFDPNPLNENGHVLSLSLGGDGSLHDVEIARGRRFVVAGEGLEHGFRDVAADRVFPALGADEALDHVG